MYDSIFQPPDLKLVSVTETTHGVEIKTLHLDMIFHYQNLQLNSIISFVQFYLQLIKNFRCSTYHIFLSSTYQFYWSSTYQTLFSFNLSFVLQLIKSCYLQLIIFLSSTYQHVLSSTYQKFVIFNLSNIFIFNLSWRSCENPCKFWKNLSKSSQFLPKPCESLPKT